MPKKFSSENTKAVAAKERKSAAKAAEVSKKEKQKEDEYWQDDDKQANKKKERKEQLERKKLEQNQRKAELKSLTEQEESSIKQASKVPLAKITKAQILLETEKRNAAIAAALEKEKRKENATHIQKPLEENVNRLVDDAIEARGISEAIAVLSVKSEVEDKHPERRLKAAFAAFEDANMTRLKAEHPTLRLSQLKQVLYKEWTKSPDNPLNQSRN